MNGWKIIPDAPAIMATGSFLVNPSPLLEEKRDILLLALDLDALDPFRLHWSRIRPRLPPTIAHWIALGGMNSG